MLIFVPSGIVETLNEICLLHVYSVSVSTQEEEVEGHVKEVGKDRIRSWKPAEVVCSK